MKPASLIFDWFYVGPQAEWPTIRIVSPKHGILFDGPLINDDVNKRAYVTGIQVPHAYHRKPRGYRSRGRRCKGPLFIYTYFGDNVCRQVGQLPKQYL